MIFYYDKTEGREMVYLDMMTLRQNVRIKESTLYRYLKKVPDSQKLRFHNRILYPYTVLKMPKIQSKLVPDFQNR